MPVEARFLGMTNQGTVRVVFKPKLSIPPKVASKIMKSHNEVFGPNRKKDPITGRPFSVSKDFKRMVEAFPA